MKTKKKIGIVLAATAVVLFATQQPQASPSQDLVALPDHILAAVAGAESEGGDDGDPPPEKGCMMSEACDNARGDLNITCTSINNENQCNSSAPDVLQDCDPSQNLSQACAEGQSGPKCSTEGPSAQYCQAYVYHDCKWFTPENGQPYCDQKSAQIQGDQCGYKCVK